MLCYAMLCYAMLCFVMQCHVMLCYSSSTPQSRDSVKLERDLITVFEKVRLCQEMLLESPGIAQDEALSEVVGFLEACRDRIIDIIEAGSMVHCAILY